MHEFVEHYHPRRNRQGLDWTTSSSMVTRQQGNAGRIDRAQRLGGYPTTLAEGFSPALILSAACRSSRAISARWAIQASTFAITAPSAEPMLSAVSIAAALLPLSGGRPPLFAIRFFLQLIEKCFDLLADLVYGERSSFWTRK
jgi:hypothetical protein